MALAILHSSKCCADETTSSPSRSATSQIDDLDEKPFAEFDGIIEYRASEPGSAEKKRRAHQITFLGFGRHTLDSVESLSRYQHIQDLTLVFRGFDPPAALSLTLKENVLNRVKSVTLSVWIDDLEFDVDELTKSLAPIQTIQDLSLLSLTNCVRVTDRSAVFLPGFGSLKTLSLSGTRVSDETIEELRASMPDLKIEAQEKE
jgi:hypothetical protein